MGYIIKRLFVRLFFYTADNTSLDFEVSIPEDKLEAMNQSTEYQWKRHPDGGIAANIAVFHQLSCLVRIQLFLSVSVSC
jgi:hypothetical protein